MYLLSSYFLFLIFNLSLLINLTKADEEAAALCAFIAATNINSKRNDWRCDNTVNKCSWNGINCSQDGKIIQFNLEYAGFNGKYYI